MVSASACILAVVQKKSRTPGLKHHVRQKKTSAETDYCKGGARVLQVCRGVNDLSIKLRLMETLCTVSPRTQANIKEPSGDVKDATPVFEKLKESEEIISSLIVNETISAKVERLANLINFQRLKDPDHLLNS